MSYYYWLAGALIFMLMGLVGVIVPAIPGMPLMMLAAGLYTVFIRTLPAWANITLLLIGIVSILIDHFSGVLGAKFAGANSRSMLVGIAGMFIGLIVFGLLGAVIGLFIGTLASELMLKQTSRKAVKVAGVGVISVFLGMVINLILGITFLTIFLVAAL
jgi:uncharacterized protein YqgC (DUF456 family)